jgi:hypothetical protein
MNYFISFFLLFISFSFNAQNLPLWNGETTKIHTCQLDYGVADSLQAFSGKWCFEVIPDNWHSPSISLNCQDTWRSDISRFDELWFYIKASELGHSTRVFCTGWPYTGNKVNVSSFMEGGKIDTIYKLVKIPIDSLKTKDFSLQNVENIQFDTSGVPNLHFYVDQFVAMDLTPIKADSIKTLSNQAIKISVSDKYDTVAVKKLTNYYISSTDDVDFTTGQHPIKVGMHYYVYDFAENGPYPKMHNELFLQFDKKLKNGKSYTLSIVNIKDLANNDFTTEQKFTFVFDDTKDINHSVKVNQVGYLPISPKLAYIGNFLGGAGPMECNPKTFEIKSYDEHKTVYVDTPDFKAYDPLSGEKVYECTFTNFTTPGKYYLYVPEIGRSYNFKIDSTVYDSVFFTTARALYYQRCGTALVEPFSDPRFKHAACHLTDGIIHSSCKEASTYNNEPIGSEMHMPGGIHDAGDYGRYIPSASTLLYDIFISYEMFPSKYYDNELNIPESGNGVPDILDQAKWEIDWFKEMQAPDGGVYFKVNTSDWPSTLPEFDKAPLYLAQKTTFSTAMYSAIMSMAYRNFKNFWPEYADTCLARAIRAHNFLERHKTADPVGGFNENPEGIGGGTLGDPEGDLDERAWASAELYKITGEKKYDSLFAIYWAAHPPYWGWNTFQQHQHNASIAYATTKFPVDSTIIKAYLQGLLITVDFGLIPQNNSNVYQNAFRSDVLGWIGWGAFAQSSRYSYTFLQAYYFFGDKKYLDYAKINLNSQLGANPQDMSYITGVGSRYPMDPLHNQSRFDTIKEPIPGLSLYGPNSHLSFANPYDAVAQGTSYLYPDGSQEDKPYPILRRFYDNHENVAMAEFDIDNLGYTAMVYGFFKSATKPTKVNPPTTGLYSNFKSNTDELLLFCYPNPTDDQTTIRYAVEKPESVTVSILDLNQKCISVLVDNKLIVGQNELIYDTSKLASGIYFCEISTGNNKKTIKMIKR